MHGQQNIKFSVDIFSRSALAGVLRTKIFHRGPNPLAAALTTRQIVKRSRHKPFT